ncbi:MTH1187 family thiamine-binding protein [Weissella diestrammenae]|uniref:MTH1187 family thiamine-binding protein n=1 Tax=Weissella diestrammenae TaxID=1162633 RepID=A0A7G9T716_9LACO|nr:MTH1187 family thiamine-binding protein [Weissella diestrammenae]MCM0582512.1 MTH1187 family thiamine-binding protein [Weissella diestrammenae]QNN75891.1 MTH1187 family thiamine-binding protein [Weissella diestrammenae]
MNTLISVAIAPLGTGDELASSVAKIIDVIEKSGLDYQTHAMTTEIEGDWDDVFAVVKTATQVLTDQGQRAYVSLNADVRPGYTKTMTEKIRRLNHARNQII